MKAMSEAAMRARLDQLGVDGVPTHDGLHVVQFYWPLDRSLNVAPALVWGGNVYVAGVDEDAPAEIRRHAALPDPGAAERLHAQVDASAAVMRAALDSAVKTIAALMRRLRAAGQDLVDSDAELKRTRRAIQVALAADAGTELLLSAIDVARLEGDVALASAMDRLRAALAGLGVELRP